MAEQIVTEGTLNDSLERVGLGIDLILAERALLLESLRNVCDASQTDSDTCAICREDLARHASGCAVAAGLDAIAKVESR